MVTRSRQRGCPSCPLRWISLVVGVGSPNSGTFVHDHQSRQDVNTLRQLANRLRGDFHNGNQKQLSSQLVSRFAESRDQEVVEEWTRREWALMATLVGSSVLACIPLLLHYFGTSYIGGVNLAGQKRVATVSYTHLTLPTNREV